MKQVPEGKLPEDAQYARLVEKLAGSDVLRRSRGKLEQLTPVISHLAYASESPTAFLDAYDRLVSDVRVFGNLYAQLLRDGCPDAARELLLALENPFHLLPGETVPLEKTEPYTLLMFAPKQTLAVLTFLQSPAVRAYEAYLAKCVNETNMMWERTRGRYVQPSNSWPCALPTMLHNLGDLLPSLALMQCAWDMVCCADRRTQMVVEPFLAAYFVDYLSLVSTLTYDLQRPMSQAFHPLATKSHVDLLSIQYYMPLTIRVPELAKYGFAFIAKGDQREVLSRFSREEQENLASWQFHLPVTRQWEISAEVLLYPEVEHAARWAKERPAYASRGVSHGWGALVMPHDGFYTPHDYINDPDGAPRRFVLRCCS